MLKYFSVCRDHNFLLSPAGEIPGSDYEEARSGGPQPGRGETKTGQGKAVRRML